MSAFFFFKLTWWHHLSPFVCNYLEVEATNFLTPEEQILPNFQQAGLQRVRDLGEMGLDDYF